MAAFFEVENVTKHFGGLVAVNNVSFQVAQDEIVPTGPARRHLYAACWESSSRTPARSISRARI
jgi:hypothetical protein